MIEEFLAVLTRTPATLNAMLRGMPDVWSRATDGPGTWSAYDVIGHLIHGEHADWIPRLRIILEHGTARPFEPFDREAQFRESAGKSLDQLLDEFAAAREESLAMLRALNLQPGQLDAEGMHPALGVVTARQLLSTWTSHDLAHILQISRTMARRYREEVGPWAQYLSVMQSDPA